MNTATAAFSIPEWCDANRISRGTFYNLQKQGIGPRIMRVGKRVLITPEANEEWRRAREADGVAA